MTDKLMNMVLMKIEMKLALERFIQYYKKASKGIEKIYTDAALSNNFEEIQKLYLRFFGYILKSKNAKELRNG